MEQNVRRNPYLAEYDTTTRRRPRETSHRGRRQHRSNRRRRRIYRQRILVLAGIACMAFLSWRLITKAVEWTEPDTTTSHRTSEEKKPIRNSIQGLSALTFSRHPDWTEDFLTVNEYSRPGDALEQVNNIFVHYTANPGTSAAQNRSYFEQLKDTHERSASAHFIIGYEGEIIQCIPLNEIAYAVRTRNMDSISIECCYLQQDGSFTQETYDSLISLLAWLTDAYHLDEEDILRHYDCGGKKCPLYYVKHTDEWNQLKQDVKSATY